MSHKKGFFMFSIKKNLKLYVSLLFIVALVCSIQACEAEDNEQSDNSSDDIEVDANNLPILDKIVLNDGTNVTFEEGPQNSIVVVTEGPTETEEDFEKKLNGAETIEDIYAALAPEREIPASIRTSLLKRNTINLDTPDAVLSGPSAEDIELAEVVDSFALNDKSVSRDVQYFKDHYCYTDKINEKAVRKDWYRRMPKCLTERTGNFTHHYYNIRQSHISVRLYRGNANIRWYWKNNGEWQLGNSYACNEGNYKTVRVAIETQMDLKWNLYNADGDGYNFAIHNAVADSSTIKTDDGADYYHVLCDCTGGVGWLVLEVCLPNKPRISVDIMAHDWCEADGCTQAFNRERVTYEDENCDPYAGYLRECLQARNCAYECEALCDLIL
jgi:hypothetical protein